MEQQNRAILTTELSEQITACAFTKEDLKTFCEILQESSRAAAEEEISYYAPLDRSAEQIPVDKELLRSGFELKITVRGADDERIYGTIPAVFDSPRFPNKVKSLYINSETDLRNLYNWYPRNRFELLLDFTKSELFNLSLSPSISTPNASNISVSGLNSDWVSGVYRKITDFIKGKRTHRRFLHRHSVYDIFVLCGGLPFAFSIAYKLSGWIGNTFGEISRILESAAYVYVFFLSLHLFKALFDYTRWVFPIVEYTGTKSAVGKHRIILGSLICGVSANFIYDLIKIIF